MEVEEPRRLERVGAAADVFIRANEKDWLNHSFDISNELLVKLKLITLDDQQLLLICCHHRW